MHTAGYSIAMCFQFVPHPQATGSLAQADLKLRFDVGGRLVNEVTLRNSRSLYWGLGVGPPHGQLAPLSQQQLPVVMQIYWLHDRSSASPRAKGPCLLGLHFRAMRSQCPQDAPHR